MINKTIPGDHNQSLPINTKWNVEVQKCTLTVLSLLSNLCYCGFFDKHCVINRPIKFEDISVTGLPRFV